MNKSGDQSGALLTGVQAPDGTTERNPEALFAFIAHGDAIHRAWLRDACHAFFAGEPKPNPPPAARWRHVRTGGIYEVLTDGALIENRGTPAVVYQGADGRVWIRPRDEFLDGRFERA